MEQPPPQPESPAPPPESLPPRRPSRLAAWLALFRVSNLPTVVSNVLVGCVLGLEMARVEDGPFPWNLAAYVMVAAVLFYLGGMVLNDAADAPLDATERPERPIPAGQIRRGEAWAAGFALLAAGLGALALLGLTRDSLAEALPALLLGAGLAAAIVLYNLIHQRVGAAVVLLGLCRGLLYLLGAAALASWPLDWRAVLHVVLMPTLALVAYVTLLSTVARVENAAALGARKWIALMIPVPVFLVALWLHPPNYLWPAVVGLLFLVRMIGPRVYLFRTPPLTRQAVLIWLSSISLVDAFFLTLLDQAQLAGLAVACWLVTVAMQRKVAGT